MSNLPIVLKNNKCVFGKRIKYDFENMNINITRCKKIWS